jgi:hypothetical protein
MVIMPLSFGGSEIHGIFMMYYIIYKTTNLINGLYYVGTHRATDLEDDYLGSGTLLKNAVRTFGKNNFVRENLFVFDEEWKMILAEKILVIVDSEITYNMCSGGIGSWLHINENREIQLRAAKKGNATRKILYENNEEWREIYRKNISDGLKGYYANNESHWTGKKHRSDSIEKMSKAKAGMYLGENNSQYGTMWITDGKNNRKIKKDEEIPEKWKRGRVL